jgi:hypothetical protein
LHSKAPTIPLKFNPPDVVDVNVQVTNNKMSSTTTIRPRTRKTGGLLIEGERDWAFQIEKQREEERLINDCSC